MKASFNRCLSKIKIKMYAQPNRINALWPLLVVRIGNPPTARTIITNFRFIGASYPDLLLYFNGGWILLNHIPSSKKKKKKKRHRRVLMLRRGCGDVNILLNGIRRSTKTSDFLFKSITMVSH